MRITICDDNIMDIEVIKHLLLSNNFIVSNGQISTFTSSTEFYHSLKTNTYDAVFLDIDMPELNGIEIGKLIKDKCPRTLIVFVTNYSEYAIEAFDCDAFHYILKPIDLEKANRIVDSLIHKYLKNNKYHLIKIKTETKKISIKDIYYIEYCRRHVIYHLKDKDYETVGKFHEIYDELKDYGFYQIHQGYIVNMSKIIEFDKYSIVLEDEKKVMMSTRKRTEVINAYTSYLERITNGQY